MVKITFSTLKISFVLWLAVFLFGTTSVEAADASKGESLFKQHCSSCHKVDAKLVGPALKGIDQKYANDKEWLYKWIKNNQALIKAGDPKAVALYNENGKQQMNVFSFLTDADVDDIIAYTVAYTPPVDDAKKAGGTTDSVDPLADPKVYYALLGVVGLLLGLGLILVFGTAALVASVRAKDESRVMKSSDVMNQFRDFLRNRFVASCLIVVALVGGSAKFIQAARGVSLHQDYMPDQPIKYSHKLHAGINQIPCQYCHSGAAKSKNAWVPSTNVCMNCHKAIGEPSKQNGKYGKTEISKIYVSAGWNPVDGKYFAPNTSLDTVKLKFKKWLEGEKNASEAYDALDIDGKYGKSIEWVRIHNLPDHAYFNHAQHVTVGGQQCQTCHGPIQNMEVVYQYSPLSMGWCITCHRQTKVKSLGQDTEHTVEDQGGLDCAKCHY